MIPLRITEDGNLVMTQKQELNSVPDQLGQELLEVARAIVHGKDDFEARDLQFTIDNLSTNTKNLTEEQKKTICDALSQKWTVPEFKVKNFIGNAQITPYAKIKQYLLELNTRESAVESMEYEVQKLYYEIGYNQELKQATDSEAQGRLYDLEILKLSRMLKKSVMRLRDAYWEREMYLKLIEEFNNSKEGYLEDGRRIYDLMNDPTETEKLEKEYWTLRLAKQTALDMIAYGRAGVGNMEAVSMLETSQQIEVMKLACDYFVRNELRTNKILSDVNGDIQSLGDQAKPTQLSKQLYQEQGKYDVSNLQIGS